MGAIVANNGFLTKKVSNILIQPRFESSRRRQNLNVVIQDNTDFWLQIYFSFPSLFVLQPSPFLRSMADFEILFIGMGIFDIKRVNAPSLHPSMPEDVEESVTERSVLELL
ncbi:hypothetical protein C491_16322 [Natronococcus amylolyticus DSM 10524]|uniref:Uncharacterized protein n=1 Tax=Natronococcus amylolyticus DSM 10524 TaxID=1227497 RepID=L9X3Y4_9EURY|nr:hypothetical protein C491_16322 [Natronococcus amylolyticus DSM 10524]